MQQKQGSSCMCIAGCDYVGKTDPFAPPEVLGSFDCFDASQARTHSSGDIWSVACFLYELLTGARLFDDGAATPTSTAQQASGSPPAVTASLSGLATGFTAPASAASQACAATAQPASAALSPLPGGSSNMHGALDSRSGNTDCSASAPTCSHAAPLDMSSMGAQPELLARHKVPRSASAASSGSINLSKGGSAGSASSQALSGGTTQSTVSTTPSARLRAKERVMQQHKDWVSALPVSALLAASSLALLHESSSCRVHIWHAMTASMLVLV